MNKGVTLSDCEQKKHPAERNFLVVMPACWTARVISSSFSGLNKHTVKLKTYVLIKHKAAIYSLILNCICRM